MSYRPITDLWILARSKTKYYGGYPAGFLERARALMGIGYIDQVLHVCSGRVKDYAYPNYAFGEYDYTLDLDPDLDPDFIGDAGQPLPSATGDGVQWDAIIADPPYTPEDAEHYEPGRDAFPEPTEIVKRMLEAVKPGGRVGILHYVWVRPPKDARLVATVGVLVGYGNRIRVFTVFERPRKSES